MASETPRRRSCFLFYVYGFFLGLGSGVISTIAAFDKSEPASDPSKILIVMACFFSVFTFTAQSVVTCRGESRAGQRSATVAVGLILTALTTIAAVASSPGLSGVFFLAGSFSAVLYLFTVAAFSVAFYRDRKIKLVQDGDAAERLRNRLRTTGDTGNSPAGIRNSNCLCELSILNGSGGSTEAVGEVQGGRRLSLLGIPQNIAPPPYSEVAGPTETSHPAPPPSYSESRCVPADHSDMPLPDYTRSPFPLLEPLRAYLQDHTASVDTTGNILSTNETANR